MRVKGLEFSADKAKKLLDSQGVVDTNGDGVREFEGQPAKLDLSYQWQVKVKL